MNNGCVIQRLGANIVSDVNLLFVFGKRGVVIGQDKTMSDVKEDTEFAAL